jgi:hypothetical protein
MLLNVVETPSVSTTVPKSGVCDGTSYITIVGQGFVYLPTLRCVWGETPSFAHYINSTAIQCQTPVAQGDVFVTVSQNGQQNADILPFHCSSKKQFK